MTKKIELRKISHNASLSEETSAYTAQVWVDGVHVCDVSNHGQGGCDMQYPAKGKTHADVEALNEYCKTTFPKQSFEAGGGTHEYDTDLEVVCGDLLAEHLLAKDLKRSLGSKILFMKPGKPGIYQCKKVKGEDPARFIAVIKETHKIERTLNEMPFDEALALYRKAG